MSDVERAMPRYRSIKTVWALKVASIQHAGQTKIFFPEDQRYAPLEASNPGPRAQLWARSPGPGAEDTGFIVQYEDGFWSWSPTKAFEKGYVELGNDGYLVELPDAEKRPRVRPFAAGGLFDAVAGVIFASSSELDDEQKAEVTGICNALTTDGSCELSDGWLAIAIVR